MASGRFSDDREYRRVPDITAYGRKRPVQDEAEIFEEDLNTAEAESGESSADVQDESFDAFARRKKAEHRPRHDHSFGMIRDEKDDWLSRQLREEAQILARMNLEYGIRIHSERHRKNSN